jgi:signal transduction histidine kinase
VRPFTSIIVISASSTVSFHSIGRTDPAEAPDVARPPDESRGARPRGSTFGPADGALDDGGSLAAYCAAMGVTARRYAVALRRPGPLRDIAVAGVMVLVGVILAFGYARKFGHLPGLAWWALAGVQVWSGACLLARRQTPLIVALAVAALSVVAATPAAAPATYGVFAYGSAVRRAWLVTFAMVAATARPWTLDVFRTRDGDLTVNFQLMLVAVLIAAALGLRRRRADTRNARAARDRAAYAEQARADERAMLAAEMHDVITHQVSLMVLQAGALQVSTSDDAVRRQADELRRSGQRALGELRQLLSVIRQGGPTEPRHPAAPARLDLTDLLAASRGVGIPVEYIADGRPLVMSAVVARTAYRVVQESLTNVRKHALGARVQLTVHRENDSLRVTVRNTGPATVSGQLCDTGTSGGLHGLRRRVELVNGSFEAGPRPGGGFEVCAVLPAGGIQ